MGCYIYMPKSHQVTLDSSNLALVLKPEVSFDRLHHYSCCVRTIGVAFTMDESKDAKHVATEAVSEGSVGPHEEVAGQVIVGAIANNGNVIDDGLQRGLKNRHLQMIAFGGVIG